MTSFSGEHEMVQQRLQGLNSNATGHLTSGSEPVNPASPNLNAVVANGAETSPESWYLRIDDKEFGPVSRSQLEYFLRPPRLCSFLQVMCTAQEGVWHAIAQNETLEKVLLRFGIVEVPTPTAVQKPNQFNLISKFLDATYDAACEACNWVSRNWFILAIAILVIGINLAFFIATRDRDREILDRFESLTKSVQKLAAEDTPSGEWKSFAARALAEVQAIESELKRTSISTRPVRRQLLGLGRDCLLRILKGDAPITTDSDEMKYLERQLKILRSQIPSD
jgi:hypothetical protein